MIPNILSVFISFPLHIIQWSITQQFAFSLLQYKLLLLIILKTLPDIYPRVPLFQFYSILHMILLLYRSILLQPHVLYFSKCQMLWRSVLRLHCFRWYNSLYELPVPQYNLSKETPQNAFLHSMKHPERLWPDYIFSFIHVPVLWRQGHLPISIENTASSQNPLSITRKLVYIFFIIPFMNL